MQEEFQPKLLHKAIRWGKGDPFQLAQGFDMPWKVVDDDKSEDKPQKKRKRATEEEDGKGGDDMDVDGKLNGEGEPSSKKKKSFPSPPDPFFPAATQWSNNSCAYDSVITVLYNLWMANPVYWSNCFVAYDNVYLQTLVHEFQEVFHAKKTLSGARDVFLNLLHFNHPNEFVLGRFASVQRILERVLICPWPVVQVNHNCQNLHVMSPPTLSSNAHVFMNHNNSAVDLQAKLASFVSLSNHVCGFCHAFVGSRYSFVAAPALISFDVEHCSCLINLDLVVAMRSYRLCGIVYYSADHFTCAVVANGNMWTHNGFQHGMTFQGPVVDQSDLYNFNGQTASAAFYQLV